MSRRIYLAAACSLFLAVPATADDVAGRPALTTKSTSDLVAQREKWGTKPSGAAAKSAAPAPAAKAAGAAAATGAAAAAALAVLPTDSTQKLIAEREKWGKGPAGYEKKKVVAPLAKGAPKSFKTAKPAPAKAAKKKKKN